MTKQEELKIVDKGVCPHDDYIEAYNKAESLQRKVEELEEKILPRQTMLDLVVVVDEAKTNAYRQIKDAQSRILAACTTVKGSKAASIQADAQIVENCNLKIEHCTDLMERLSAAMK